MNPSSSEQYHKSPESQVKLLQLPSTQSRCWDFPSTVNSMQILNKPLLKEVCFLTKNKQTFYKYKKCRVNSCLLALTLGKLLIYTTVSRNQTVQQFCLKAEDTHTREREGGEEDWTTALQKKAHIVPTDNLFRIQALTIKATEMAPHRYLLVSMKVKRLNRH